MAGGFIFLAADWGGPLASKWPLTLFPFLNNLPGFQAQAALPCQRTSWHDYAQLTLGEAHEILVHAVV